MAGLVIPAEGLEFQDPSDRLLPGLRDDLEIFAGPTVAGAPTWTINDRARHRYFRIGWLEYEVLSRWGRGTARAVARAVAEETTVSVAAEDVLDIARFLQVSELTRPDAEEDSRRLLGLRRLRRRPLWERLLHHYIFFRVPLFNPDRFLERTLPLVRPFFSAPCAALTVGLALLGLLLILRRFQEFIHAFDWSFDLTGAVALAAALSVSKSVHEFGHAYAAKRLGCRVPRMGVAFMVFFPVLWTDVSDAWKLKDARSRLAIDAAGMLAELGLSAVAAILWAVLPDGPERGAMRLLASTTWAMTLFVNLNPLMRYDGYYLLSDALDVPNLQDRAFALARWRLRRLLFGPTDPAPEILPPRQTRIMLLYAYGAWIYRFFLFLGIALLVYHKFFKILGVFLMAVEVFYFILGPILREVRGWSASLGRSGDRTGGLVALVLLGLAGLALAVPWSRSLELPALLTAGRLTAISAPQAARVEELRLANGQTVRAGEALLRLSSPKLDHDAETARLRLERLTASAALASLRPDLARDGLVGRHELLQAELDLRGLRERQDRLVIRAPFDGVALDVPEDLAVGSWLAAKEECGLLADREAPAVWAYVDEEDAWRITPGAAARFYPNEPESPSLPLTVDFVDRSATRDLTHAELASPFHGPIAARPTKDQGLVPERAVYRVRLVPAGGTRPPRQAAGSVLVETDRASLLARLFRLAAAAFIREASF